MRIGELSRRSGISVRMLRYYETAGLLRPARLPSGYRVYGNAEVEIVERVHRLNAAGLTLAVIRRILPCARAGSLDFEPCAAFRHSLHQRIKELDSRISELSESRRLLAGYLATASTAASSSDRD